MTSLISLKSKRRLRRNVCSTRRRYHQSITLWCNKPKKKRRKMIKPSSNSEWCLSLMNLPSKRNMKKLRKLRSNLLRRHWLKRELRRNRRERILRRMLKRRLKLLSKLRLKLLLRLSRQRKTTLISFNQRNLPLKIKFKRSILMEPPRSLLPRNNLRSN